MTRESKGYVLILFLFCLLGLLIYGAYSPARKAQKQQIMCFSFKEGIKTGVIEKHMHDFAGLKHEIPQIVGYSAGKTFAADAAGVDYDVVHYITFQSADDLKAFQRSAAYQRFVADNQAAWARQFTVTADIQP